MAPKFNESDHPRDAGKFAVKNSSAPDGTLPASSPVYGDQLQRYIRGLQAEADAYGYDEDGFDFYGADEKGIDFLGFGADGIHVRTGTAFAPGRNGYAPGLVGNLARGRDVHGFDDRGFDGRHYDASGNLDPQHIAHVLDENNPESEDYLWHARGKIKVADLDYYDTDGYSPVTGRNTAGFNRQGLDAAGCREDGFDANGYDAEGYDRDNQENPDVLFTLESGLNRFGFDAAGRNVFSGRLTARADGDFGAYGPDGFDELGINAAGYDRGGWSFSGADLGYNVHGYSTSGEYHREHDPRARELDNYDD